MHKKSFSICSRPFNVYVPGDRVETRTATSETSQTRCLCWSSAGETSTQMALIEQGDTAPAENCHRLVLVGSSKVGKTSVVSRFLSNKFTDNYTPTIEDFHRKVYRIKGVAYRLDILDTSGNHPFPAMRRLSLLTGWSMFRYNLIELNIIFSVQYRDHVGTRPLNCEMIIGNVR